MLKAHQHRGDWEQNDRNRTPKFVPRLVYRRLGNLSFFCDRDFPRASFRVTLRSQSVDAARPLQPFINFGFTLEPLDVANLGPWIMGFDLPIAFGDPLHFENDTFFSHEAEYRRICQGRKRQSVLPC
jgi:hypothetical protein